MTSPLDTDFDELEIGATLTTRGRTISETDVVQFACLTGDLHPVHTDAEWAAESRFGGRMAHGLLVLSYAIGLIPFDPERVLVLRGIRDAVFKRPTRLGDTVRVEVEIRDKREVDEEHGLVTWGWRVVDQEGRLLARATVDVLWKRDARTTAASDGEPQTALG